MNYYAHSENLNKEMHLLSKHLIEVANICESFTTNNIYKPIFKLAGLTHDLGKFNDEFQKYLLNQNKNFKISHANIGAYYLKYKSHPTRVRELKQKATKIKRPPQSTVAVLNLTFNQSCT